MLQLPDLAQAHTGGSDTGLIDGLMHPVFGLDHLLAMISVGVVSAQLGGNNIWRIPAVFVGAMILSAMLASSRSECLMWRSG
jgi:urease accessory protein